MSRKKEMRTPPRAGASTTPINPDDDSAGEVTRANRSFRVSHLANDRPASRRVAILMEADIFSALRSTFAFCLL